MEIQNVSAATAMGPVSSANMPIEYAPKVDLSTPQDTVEFSSKNPVKEKVSTAKKIGVGLASAIVPGIGQFCNGQGGKGVAHLLANFALRTGTGAFIALCPPLAIACGVGSLVLGIASIVDAVKNA